MACTENTAVIVPSLNPDVKFYGVIDDLIKNGFTHIIVVDDGSDPQHQELFDRVAAFKHVSVIHHDINRGKGRALKTAFKYASDCFPECSGVITVDGDGQHLTKDIIACGEKMLENPDSVVLGCRDFSQPGIPPRSVFGNRMTSRLFKLFFGIKLSDTQTGLRAIPSKYLSSFCDIAGERFEYETNMLLQMKRKSISLLEQSITTVYDQEDYSSHYNAVKDSWRILKIMFKFMVSK